MTEEAGATKKWPDVETIRPRASQNLPRKPMSSTTTNAEENFEFASMPTAGKVNVANHSHDDGSKNHTYTVTVEDDGRTTHCTCPSDKYHEGACKHRVAVEETDGVLRPANCACEGLTSLPCWQCFRFGFETNATEGDR